MKIARHLGLFVVLGLASLSCADATAVTIDAKDTAAIAAAKGTGATVQGKVSAVEWSASGKVCTIEFENAPGFVAAAFEKTKAKLNEAFGGDFVKGMTGATIKITGKINPYGGRDPKYKNAMQIIIARTSQITVAQPATASSTQPTG